MELGNTAAVYFFPASSALSDRAVAWPQKVIAVIAALWVSVVWPE